MRTIKLVSFELRKLFAGKIKWILMLIFFLNLAVYYVYLIPSMPTENEKRVRKEWEQVLKDRNEDIESDLQFLKEEQTDVSIMWQYFNDREFLSEYDIERVLEKYSGTQYMDEKNVTTGNLILYQLLEEYQAAADYQTFIGNIEERGKNMLQISIFSKEGGFAQKNILKTVKDFQRVKEIEVEPVNGNGISRFQEFYLTDILLLLVVCLLCFLEFGQDSRSGMGDLIQATPRGKGTLRFAQMRAIWIAVLGAAILFYGGNLIQTGCLFNMNTFSAYVQSIAGFRNVSLPFTIGTYLVLFILGKAAALLFVSICCQFLAVKFNGQKIAWVLFGAAVGISFLLWFLIPDTPAAKIFRYLNLVGLLDMKQILGSYQNLNIFSQPISLLSAAVFVIAVPGALIAGITLVVNRTCLRITKMDKPISQRGSVHKSLLYYEYYKIFRQQKIWLIGLGVLLLAIQGFDLEEEYIRGKDFYYEKYITEVEGDYTEEKALQIEALTADKDMMDDKQSAAVDKLYEQYQNLDGQPDRNVGFVNLRTLEKFFFDKKNEIISLLILVIAVILSVSSLFYKDKKSGIYDLLRAAPFGMRVYWSKIKLAGLLGGLYALILWGFTYGEYFIRYGIENSHYGIQSIPQFAEVGFECSILGYMMITVVLRCVIGVYIGIFMAFLAQVFAVPTQNIVSGILLLVLPLCMYYIGNMGYDNPLVHFINGNLGFALRPVKLLASFQAECHTLSLTGGIIIILLPVLTAEIGKRLWSRK